MDRKCTDIICCIIFLAYFLLMLAIGAYGLAEGDPLKIITPFDSDGNQCGQPGQAYSDAELFPAARDFTEFKYKAFTNPELIIAGVADQATAVATNAVGIERSTAMYNAVCVIECPGAILERLSC